MKLRNILVGNRAAIIALSAAVDKAAGCPIIGRNADTGELMPDAQQTVTMSSVIAHPTDPNLAAYEIDVCNRELVAMAGPELAKAGYDLSRDISTEQSMDQREWVKPKSPREKEK